MVSGRNDRSQRYPKSKRSRDCLPQWCPVGTTGVSAYGVKLVPVAFGVASMVSGRNDRSQVRALRNRHNGNFTASMVSGRNDRSQRTADAPRHRPGTLASMVSGRNDRSQQPFHIRPAMRQP